MSIAALCLAFMLYRPTEGVEGTGRGKHRVSFAWTDTLLSVCDRWMALLSRRTAPAQQGLPRQLYHINAHLPGPWARQTSMCRLAALT